MKALLAAMGMLLLLGAISPVLAEGDCPGKAKSVKTADTTSQQGAKTGG
jgi:hypothetical protein